MYIFSSRSSGKKIILNDKEEENLRLMREKDFQEFHELRDLMLSLRETDRIARNKEKEKQLAEYEQLQVITLLPRKIIRGTFRELALA